MLPVVPRRSAPFEETLPVLTPSLSPLKSSKEVSVNAERWESEAWAEAASKQLKRLADWLEDPRRNHNTFPPITEERLFGLMAGYTRRLRHGTAARASFKIIDVQTTLEGFMTIADSEIVYPAEAPEHQWNQRWRCEWRIRDGGHPLIQSMNSTSSTWSDNSSHDYVPRFEDVTAFVLDQTASFPQHAVGVDIWSQRLTRIDEMTLQGHHGLAVGDVNGDGRDDLYVCDGGGLPNRLLLQQPDGTLNDISVQSKTDWLESSSAALLVDFDNDGDDDLVVATVPLLLFSENVGNGRFEFRGGHHGVPGAYTLAAADYDQDGDVDLYATNYSGKAGSQMGARGFEAQAPIPFHDANNGGRNALLENRGGFAFVDVTEKVGLDENNRRFSFAAAWEDFDDDGDQDLYVANDFGRNNLYQNDHGRFTDVAAKYQVEDIGAGMSVDWADVDRDGRMDLYVGNMFSAAGNRVTKQRRFLDEREDNETASVQRMARGNALFLNREEGFQDISIEAGVSRGLWAWSSRFIDINNDGWQDVIVANGYVTNRRADDL